MKWLNYHHLYYFFVIVREGSISAAARELRLSQPTLSAQLGQLEKAVGLPLFDRKGRKLLLSETGKMVHEYAQEIFSMGRELQDAITQRRTGSRARLNVGVADVLPKTFVYEFLHPLFDSEHEGLRVTCREGRADELLAELALHRLDLVLMDQALLPDRGIRAYTHVLGESGVTLLGRRNLVGKYRKGFPESLEGAPLILPMPNTSLRREIDHWFETREIAPRILAEFDDSALLKLAGGRGAGIFPAPSVVEQEIREQFRVEILGELPGVTVRFYVITAERKIKNPLVAELMKAAREGMLRPDKARRPA